MSIQISFWFTQEPGLPHASNKPYSGQTTSEMRATPPSLQRCKHKLRHLQRFFYSVDERPIMPYNTMRGTQIKTQGAVSRCII